MFGTLGNNLTKAQLLPSLDGEWKEGPELPSPGNHAEKQCLIKVKAKDLDFSLQSECSSLKSSHFILMFAESQLMNLEHKVLCRPVVVKFDMNEVQLHQTFYSP